MKTNSFLLGILILLCACGQKVQMPEKNKIQQTSVPDYIQVSENYIQINIPTKQLAVEHPLISIDSTMIPCPGFETGSKPLFNIQSSQILIATSKSDLAYVVDLDSMEIIKEYRMRQALDLTKNPEGIPCDCALNLTVDLEGADFYANDDIILQINNKLLIINTSGEIIDSIPLTDPKFVYANLYDVPVDYNPLTNKIYVYRYCYECKSGSMDYYSHSFEMGINASSKEIVDENLRYPEIYGLFGLIPMETMYRTAYQNFQYFTFFPDHRIYIYNTLNSKINVYGGQSNYSYGKVWTTSKLETDFDKMLTKMEGNDVYFQLVYDDVNKRYYRLMAHPVKIDRSGDAIKFEKYVQIFNSQFELEDEIKFDRFGSFYFSYGGKLHYLAIKSDAVMLYSYTFK